MAMKRTFKTKRKLSGVRSEFRSWDKWDEGDVLIGKLVGSSQNRMNKDKKDWVVQCEETFFADKKEMKRLAGKVVTLNCAGQLDKGMEMLENGSLFQVTYNGQKEMEGGKFAGKMAHTMEVEEVTEGDDDEEGMGEEEEEDDEDL